MDVAVLREFGCFRMDVAVLREFGRCLIDVDLQILVEAMKNGKKLLGQEQLRFQCFFLEFWKERPFQTQGKWEGGWDKKLLPGNLLYTN